MPIDWKTPEAYQRLLAAIVAAQEGMKLDYRRIATMYGQGATYDSIEGRFRIIKREAKTLRSSIDPSVIPTTGRVTLNPPTSTTASFASSASSQSTTPKKPKTPSSKNKDAVLAGRVSKNGTPTRKGGKVKEEAGAENGEGVKVEAGGDWGMEVEEVAGLEWEWRGDLEA